nr:hypothetical protein [Tanacetum cinerariifolium]
MGYYFYFSPEKKIVVARYAKFLEKNLLSQKISGRAEELEEIQDEDTSPSENTSKNPMEVWGCEALVKGDTLDKLQQRFIKCIFVGYPKETMGYYFYFLPEKKIVVARYAEFLEKNILSQEISGRAEELKEIQDEDTSPSENTSKNPMKVEGFEPPQEEVVPVCSSTKTHQDLDRLYLNVEVKEHSLGDPNETANYKATILILEFDKWLDAMNAEMQSMKDNQVWCLVDLSPNSKGFTQTYEVNYEETFSPVAGIRAIRILI